VPFTLDVMPPLLSMGGLRQQLVADRLSAVAAALNVAGGDAGAAAGEPGLAGALGELGVSGARSVGTVSVLVGGLGANLGAAGDAYLAADLAGMPGG